MATETNHIECANRTQQTIRHLLSDLATHSPWIATAAFYKALHIVEAVFSNDRAIQHTSNHGERDEAIKTTRKYHHLYRHYTPLYWASQNARYLLKCENFDDYMPLDDVPRKLLKHHLLQLEKSARKFLSSPELLVGIETAFGGPSPSGAAT